MLTGILEGKAKSKEPSSFILFNFWLDFVAKTLISPYFVHQDSVKQLLKDYG